MGASTDAKAASASAPDAGAGGALGRVSELAWKALPAIGSAIGFAGFVAIVGGAVEWIRFDAAQLPATQAVLAVPKQELVIEGARVLIVFVVAAVLAVLLVYLIDSDGNATPRTARGLVAVGAVGLLVSVVFVRGHHGWSTYALLIAALSWITVVALYAVGLVMRDFRRRTKLKHARSRVLEARAAVASAEDARDGAEAGASDADSATTAASAQAHGAVAKARSQFERAIREWAAAADRVIALHKAGARDRMGEWRDRVRDYSKDSGSSPGLVELEARLDESEEALGNVFGAMLGQAIELPGFGLIVAGALGTGGLIILLIALGLGDLPTQVVLLAGVVVLLTTMNIFVARATDKFAWYGISVFFSVLMFGAALTIASTLEEPTVQPIALVRKDNEIGTCGVYITQTSDRVYVGRLPSLGERPGEIFWVRTSDVDLVSVGQSELVGKKKDERRFSNYAESMLVRLYKDRAEEAAPTLKNETISEEGKKPASKKQAERIHGLHVVTSTETREAPPKTVRSQGHPPVAIDGANCTATQHVRT